MVWHEKNHLRGNCYDLIQKSELVVQGIVNVDCGNKLSIVSLDEALFPSTFLTPEASKARVKLEIFPHSNRMNMGELELLRAIYRSEY